LEAIWNRNHNPVSDVLAVAAAKGILRHLPVVLSQDERDGSDDDVAIRRARTGLSTAAVRAGLAFSNTETALAHALSYRLTIEKGVKHGVACSFSLPRVMELAMGVDEGRDAVIQAVFSDFRQAPTHTQTHDKQPWKHLDGWLNEVGVSTCLEDYGFAGEADFRERCAVGVTNRRGRNFLGKSVK
jgi:alcohol dehydrogenase class IV